MSAGKRFGPWQAVSKLGDGGNAEVWLCTKPGGARSAVKVLLKAGPTAYERFKYEVGVMASNADLDGVLPIIESHLPPAPSESDIPWYSMPEAVLLETALAGKSSAQIIKVVATLASTLATLHERDYSHRDLKPRNLYMLDGRPCIGDFGLADHPDKDDHTRSGERIGARWTLAPEMERTAKLADGKLADVYSLAKTLWILVSGISTGFEGQYDARDISLSLASLRKDSSLSLLDSLLTSATSNSPLARPTMHAFGDALREFDKTLQSFASHSISRWRTAIQQLFPVTVPLQAKWDDLLSIVNVLRIIGRTSLNHMFFPDGGGLDLRDAQFAAETGCALIDAQLNYIVRPKTLHFEHFPDFPDWSYFYLETAPLPLSGVHETPPSSRSYEELVEVTPGTYVSRAGWDDGMVNLGDGETPAPATARLVGRYLGGSFLIVSKASMYNQIDDYSGSHNRVSPAQFRKTIGEVLRGIGPKLKDLEKKKPDEDDLWSHLNESGVAE